MKPQQPKAAPTTSNLADDNGLPRLKAFGKNTTSNISNEFEEKIRSRLYALWGNLDVDSSEFDFISRSVFKLVAAYIQQECNRARVDSKLQKAIDMSGNEFAMGYDDSGCFWRFYYGNRGAGSMMEGWPRFNSESPEVGEALNEFIEHLNQGGEDE